MFKSVLVKLAKEVKLSATILKKAMFSSMLSWTVRCTITIFLQNPKFDVSLDLFVSAEYWDGKQILNF